ncbi:protein kinase-like domain [Elysia marginata]|uniref:Protein kinase-like domain n=1 Tax=Elysia marginata TaxID=1093978 RepID=A0AAV4GTW4_9GAST|nr:protein kinase-like domain [Elysia marginata]
MSRPLSLASFGHQSDIYAIGVMFWCLVSGEDPEQGADLLERLAATDVNLSQSQRTTLERLLEPNPEKRPCACQVVKMLSGH